MNIIERIVADTEGRPLERSCALYAERKYRTAGAHRRYSGEPYILHNADVVGILRSAKAVGTATLCAGWLHGLMDHAGVKEDELERVAGAEIARICSALSKDGIGLRSNPAMRKMVVDARLRIVSRPAKSLYVATIVANARDLAEYDLEFARGWMRAKSAQLLFLRDVPEPLFKRAELLISSGMATTA